MKNEEVILKKIELKSFIDSLINIYNEGVDFIDIIGLPGPVQDSISIVERKCKEQLSVVPLTEKDINNSSLL